MLIISGEKLPKKVRENRGFVFWNRTRIYILFLTLACVTFIQMNTLTFNFTVICMKDIVEDHNFVRNYTDLHWFERNTERSLLFSGAAIGGLIGLIPTVPLINSIGFRNVQTISGLFSACGSFLFPLAVSIGFHTSLLCRIFQGIGSSIMFTTIGVVPSVWAPNNEVNTFMAVLSSVSKEEAEKISAGKVEKIREPVPYLAMCKDPTVLASWISCFGGHLGFFTLSLYGPTYLRNALRFDVKETGFLTALPFILAAVSKFSAGQISDKMTFLSEKARFVFFAATSQYGFAAGLAVMAITSSRFVAFNFAIVCSGMNIMGVIKCVQLRCRQHVHFSMVIISLTAYAVQFVAPVLVSVLCPDSSAEQFQWTKLFLLITGFIIFCNIGFPFATSSEAADYTKIKENIFIGSL